MMRVIYGQYPDTKMTFVSSALQVRQKRVLLMAMTRHNLGLACYEDPAG